MVKKYEKPKIKSTSIYVFDELVGLLIKRKAEQWQKRNS